MRKYIHTIRGVFISLIKGVIQFQTCYNICQRALELFWKQERVNKQPGKSLNENYSKVCAHLTNPNIFPFLSHGRNE